MPNLRLTPRKWFWKKQDEKETKLDRLLIELNQQLSTLTQIVNTPHRRAVISVSAAYSVQYEDSVILADATGGAFTVTLPPVTETLKPITIVRMNGGGNAVTIGGTVNGAANPTLASQYAKKTVISNGTVYVEIA